MVPYHHGAARLTCTHEVTTMPQDPPDRPESGQTLVLLHGSGDTALTWTQVTSAMGDSPYQTVLALDLPGHGSRAGEPLPAPPAVAAYAADVRTELERRGLAAVTLAGHSLGSAIALRLALDAPHLVARVGLIGAGARLRVLPALLEAARDRPEAARRQLIAFALAPMHADQAAELVARSGPLAEGALYTDLSACDGFDVMAELGGIAQPCLIAVGAEDRLTPPKYAAYLAAHLPHATLVEVPDAGHALPSEAPVALARALAELAG
jgi:pimeloyl-ACP methyl ester carboxylesterase